MDQSTMSLFEREIRDKITAATLGVADAERRSDPSLLQAAQSQLEGLVELARRNGVLIDLLPATETPTATA